MTRQEQIEVATAAYINGRLRNNVPPEEIEEIRLAYQAGAIYADAHPQGEDAGALMYVLNKGCKIGWNDAVEEACNFLNLYCNDKTHHYLVVEDIEEFRKHMKEKYESRNNNRTV